jgi:hypothetical protein
MNGKMAIAGMLGGALGITLFVVCARLPAQGQGSTSGTQNQVVVRRGTLEYKVVYADITDNDNASVAGHMGGQFSILSREGWEYVGPIVERSKPGGFQGGYMGVGGVFILFKRVTTK